MKIHELPQAVQDCHTLLEWIIPQLDKFPRLRRYTLGEHIENGLLEVLDALLEAAYSPRKRAALTRANQRLDRVRHLWRLSQRLNASSFKSYTHGAEQMVALGQQIGGWRRQADSSDK